MTRRNRWAVIRKRLADTLEEIIDYVVTFWPF